MLPNLLLAQLEGCPMKFHIALVAQIAIAVIVSNSACADSLLDDARKLVAAQQYDSAIDLLNKYVSTNPMSADGYLLLANAHHWKKDFPKARVCYEKAATLDARYALDIISLIDELNEWKEIIRIAGPELQKNKKLRPSILGSLASAYKNLDKHLDAERVINILATNEYEGQDVKDYKNYVLAYYHLWSSDTRKAKDRLKQIRNKAYLRYARTDDKFKKLQSDAEFLELTK